MGHGQAETENKLLGLGSYMNSALQAKALTQVERSSVGFRISWKANVASKIGMNG